MPNHQDGADDDLLGAYRPLRVFVFSDRPDSLLMIVPESTTEVLLPELTAPFTKEGVARAFGEAGLLARVVESVSGRWTHAMTKADRDAKAVRAAEAMQREAAEAVVLKGSTVPLIRERAVAMERKLAVDAEIRELKLEIGKAKSDAFTKRLYMKPEKFRGLEQRLTNLKVESQALQAKFTELRATEKGKGNKAGRSDAQRFMDAAADMLSPEVYAMVKKAAQSDPDDSDDDDDDDMDEAAE